MPRRAMTGTTALEWMSKQYKYSIDSPGADGSGGGDTGCCDRDPFNSLLEIVLHVVYTQVSQLSFNQVRLTCN